LKYKILAIATLATAFSTGPAFAYWHGAANQSAVSPEKKKGPHPSNWDLTVSLLFSSTPANDGPCTGGKGNADYCPSGDCLCYIATGTAKGSAGNGPATFYETYDVGGEFGPTDGESGCAPVYGDIEIAGKVDTESIAFTGTSCFSNVSLEFLAGGCQLTDSEKYSEVGLGECRGNVFTIVPLPFTIKGRAE
jgi:hypothetical protein